MPDKRHFAPNAIPPRSSSTGAPTGLNSFQYAFYKSFNKSPGGESVNYTTCLFNGKSSWSAEKDKILLGPYEYLDAQPGKDVRSQLIAAFNQWLEVPSESLEIITKVIGMLHTSSLLVDDVQDSSLLRRGLPVAHNIFGTAQTINSANYVYFLALQELQKLRSPKTITIYTEELLKSS
ncbi:Geranylgeranyl pyrophosphate synthase [Erysiphe necator]|nr:Geranylgeranyl pyrophosphate synthase [Erysiphe necator]